MAWYLRKSLRFGPVRFNLSKSGVGVSAGVRGMRVGSGPRGNYVHMGRHGVYYRKALPSGAGQPSRTRTSPGSGAHAAAASQLRPSTLSETSNSPGPAYNAANLIQFDSAGTAQIMDSDTEELLQEIRMRHGRLRLVWAAALVPALLAVLSPYALAAALLTIPAAFIADDRRRRTVVFYNPEDEAEPALQRFYAALDELMKSERLWNISGRAATVSARESGGAQSTLLRSPVKMSYCEPPQLKTNIKVPRIPAGRQVLYFMPDMLMVCEGRQVGAVSYSKLHLEHEVVQEVEYEAVAADAQQLSETWQYVNKDGSPDRRYKQNRRLPIVRYHTWRLWSESGLNERFMVSRADLAHEPAAALAELQQAISAETE